MTDTVFSNWFVIKARFWAKAEFARAQNNIAKKTSLNLICKVTRNYFSNAAFKPFKVFVCNVSTAALQNESERSGGADLPS